MTNKSNIHYLLNASSVALLGCSEGNVAGSVLANLIRNKFEGKIYPVHPRNETVLGFDCYPNLAAIPNEVEVCVVALRSDLVLESVEQMHAKGVRAAVILASGFSEIGEEGRVLERELAKKLKEYNIAACGPNCLGLVNVHTGLTLYSAACDLRDLKGKVGIVSHSGSICIAFTSAARLNGFSYLVSCGNEAGQSVGDYVEAMVLDNQTEVIAAFLETIRDPSRLKEASQLALNHQIPIIMLKVGKSQIAQATAAAHSGALASPSDIADAYLKQNHILQVDSLDELSEASQLFLHLRKYTAPGPSKVALTAISGGQLGFCCDAADEKGVAIASVSEETLDELRAILPKFATAKNPLDVTTALFDPKLYKDSIKVLASDDEVGLVMICQDAEMNMHPGEINLYRNIIKCICEVRSEIEKPIVVFSPLSTGLLVEFENLLSEAGIPLLQGAHESMVAVKLYFEWLDFINNPGKAEVTQRIVPKVPEYSDKTLSEHESKNLLRLYGVDVAEERIAHSRDEAVLYAQEIGFPVVLKVNTPDILHKTEAGIICLDLWTEKEVGEAYEEILSQAKAYDDGARLEGVSVQEMVSGGVEIMLGGKRDSVFGPTVMVGLGGIFVELFKDYALRLAPIDLGVAHEMINSLKGKDILFGARGVAKADVNALAETLVKLGNLVSDQHEILQEIDINPLKVLEEGKGVKAVDALVVLRDSGN